MEGGKRKASGSRGARRMISLPCDERRRKGAGDREKERAWDGRQSEKARSVQPSQHALDFPRDGSYPERRLQPSCRHWLIRGPTCRIWYSSLELIFVLWRPGHKSCTLAWRYLHSYVSVLHSLVTVISLGASTVLHNTYSWSSYLMQGIPVLGGDFSNRPNFDKS